MILIIELMLFNKNFRLSPSVIGIFLALVAIGLFLFSQFQVPGGIFNPILNFNGETVTSQNYFITQFKVLPLYFRLFLVPLGQNFDHDIRISNSFTDADVLIGFGIILLIISFAIYMYKYNRLITFGILWMIITISVESSIIPIADVVFEHRVYLPMLGLIVALLAGLFELFAKKEKLIPVLLIFVFLVTGTNAVLANQRNNVWNSELTLWTDAVNKSPQKPRAYFKRAQANLEDGKVAWALYDFSKVIEYRPEFISAYTYRAAIYLSLNNLKDAISDYDKFIELSKDKTQGYLSRARAYKKSKRYGKALEDYDKYLKKNNLDSDVYLEKAEIYESANDAVNAIKISRQALKADTSNPRAMLALGKYYYMSAKFDSALVWLDRTINSKKVTKGTILNAYNIKGSTLYFKNDYDAALAEYMKAQEINKYYPPLLTNLALIYRTKGQYENELEIIDRFIEKDENNDKYWLARGVCNINLKKYKDADKDLRNAIRINNSNREANIKLLSIQKMLL
jgi:tetratricopeptide (TPR) repeat protein